VGMKNKLIHYYFGVNFEIVWGIIEKDLKELNEVINKILNNEDKNIKNQENKIGD